MAHSARNSNARTRRTPPSWLAAGALDQMPAARGPEMHHASLCAGAYLKGHRDANGWPETMCGERVDLLRGEKERKQWSIPTLIFEPRRCSPQARPGAGKSLLYFADSCNSRFPAPRPPLPRNSEHHKVYVNVNRHTFGHWRTRTRRSSRTPVPALDKPPMTPVPSNDEPPPRATDAVSS